MENQNKNIDLKLFAQTLMPSTTSAILSFLAGIILCLGVIFLSRYRDSSIRQGYLQYESSGHHLALSFLNKSIFSTGILGNSLIFAFWLVAGVLVYVIAADLVKSLKSGIEVEKELSYVNLDRSSAIHYIVIRLLIRAVTLAIWIPYLLLFVHKIIPYAIYLGIAASGSGSLILIPLYVIASSVVTAAAIHINVVLLRLLLLRTRVFFSQLI